MVHPDELRDEHFLLVLPEPVHAQDLVRPVLRAIKGDQNYRPANPKLWHLRNLTQAPAPFSAAGDVDQAFKMREA